MTPEGIIEKYLADKIKELHGFNRRVEWIGKKGCPDNFIALNGVMAFVECKAEKGGLSIHQKREIATMQVYKVPVFVVYSKEDVDKVIRWLSSRQEHINQ